MRWQPMCALLIGCGGTDKAISSTDPGLDSGTMSETSEDTDSSTGGGAGGDGDVDDSGDTGADSGDTATTDTGADTGDPGEWPLDGMGTLSGACGDMLSVPILEDPTPLLFQTVLDLGAEGFTVDALSEGGTKIWEDGNLGGSSAESEVVAYEVLYRCEAASLVKSEAEVVYTDPSGKKTDLIVSVDGVVLGVSVTRAVGWPREDPYTVEDATELLSDKLADIPLSSANVSAEDAWARQILSVIAYDAEHAASIETAWLALGEDLRGDTVLFVTTTDGNDEALY